MNAPTDNNPATNPRLSQANLAPAVAARPAPAAPVQPPPGGAPDIGAMIRRVFAHWQVVIVTLLLGGLITAQVVRTRKPAFKSETVIFYREGIGKSITGPTEDKDSLRTLGTKLKETLLAQQTLRRIIDEFHLYPEIVSRAGYADAVDIMRKKTEFKSRSQDTFAISFEGTNRDEAQRVCARMADLLVSENAKRLAEENRSTTEFLEVEKRRADEELERIEREISEFLHLHPQFAGKKEGLGIESLAQHNKVETELKKRRQAAIRGGRARSREGASTAAALPGAPAAAAPAVDPVLLQARSQAQSELNAARKELNDKSLKFTPAHPDVRAAEARVAAAEANLKAAEDAIAAAQPKEDAPAPRKVAAASGDDPYGEPSARPKAGPATAAPVDSAPPPRADPAEKVVNIEMEWERMERAHGMARGRQIDLENKLYRAEMIASTAESGYGTTISVLDPAYRPSGPSNAPNKTVVMIGLAASVVVGLVLSAAWGLFLDDRVFSPAEIEVIVMVPVLGAVPKEREKKKKGKEKGAAPGKGLGVSRA
jgi:uncharacterized protein involved in exopolysaccharide biosynthesis